VCSSDLGDHVLEFINAKKKASKKAA
jgi:hypothetical protein